MANPLCAVLFIYDFANYILICHFVSCVSVMYVCNVCLSYVSVMCVCHVCMSCVSVMCVCHVCLSCMSVMCVCHAQYTTARKPKLDWFVLLLQIFGNCIIGKDVLAL